MRALQKTQALWLSLLLLFCCNYSQAETELTEAAKVIMAKGSATATDKFGNQRSLARRSIIYVGDTLRTDTDSLLQLRFTDKAMMTLRENTEFFIEEYIAGDDSKGGTAIMKLLSGGFRTITGSIGKGESDDYSVTSNAASIGIRGTHYEAVQTSDQKLLVAVWQGGIKVSNTAGTMELGADRQFSFSVVQPNTAPKGLLTPPAQIKAPPIAEMSKSSAKPEDKKQDTVNTSKETLQISAAEDSGTEPGTSESLLQDNQTNVILSLESEDQFEKSGEDTALQSSTVENTLSNPEFQRWSKDPRLTEAEGNQFLSTNRLGIVTLAGPREEILATIIAPQLSTGFDYESNSASFTLSYSTGADTTITDSVTVTLNTNLLDQISGTIAENLIADINNELASTPVVARETSPGSGQIGFYTSDPQNDLLSFRIENFNTSGSATEADLIATLGGITSNTEAFSSIDTLKSDHLKVVYDANGNPVFISPVNDPNSSTASVLVDENGIIDTAALETAADLTPEAYEVFRRGDANTPANIPDDGHANVTWGIWNGSSENPIQAYTDPNDYQKFEPKDDSVYWVTAEAAQLSNLTGEATFTASRFMGSGSSGTVQTLSGGFTVDFNRSDNQISGGVLNLTTSGNTNFTSETWQTTFNGTFKNAQAHFTIDSGSISGGTNCTSCVEGNIDGIFVEPGDAFAGGFKLENLNDKNVHVEGVMVMEKQSQPGTTGP